MLEKQYSCVWSRLTVLYRKGKCLLPFAGHKTGVIKPGISTKGPIVIKYYEIPLFVLTVYRRSQWILQSCPLIAVVQMQLLDSCVLVSGAGREHFTASLSLFSDG